MSKSKPLSRNKSIELMHSATGKTYKECRATLKAHNWRVDRALGLYLLPQALYEIKEATYVAGETLSNFINESVECFKILTKALSEALTND